MHRGVWEGTIKIDLKDVSFQDYGAGYNPMAFLLNTVNIWITVVKIRSCIAESSLLWFVKYFYMPLFITLNMGLKLGLIKWDPDIRPEMLVDV